MSLNAKLLVLAACLAVGTVGGVTLAAFSGQTSNSGNTFSAASTFPGQLRMASGTYQGNGNDNRSIAGFGFQPDLVIVKRNGGSEAYMKTNTMSGDSAKRLVGGNALDTNRIQSLDSDGFELGNDDGANRNGDTYYWVAFKAAAGALKLGTYVGNGSSQSITGVGFSPEYVILADAGTERAMEHFSGSSSSYRFDADAGSGNRVTSLNADGFSVGSDNLANRSGRTYHYVAFNESAGAVKVGSYSGNGSSKSVTGVGFAPQYVNVRADASQTGQHRSATVPGSESLYFQNSSNVTTGITALQSDGFQVGNNASVNASSTTYRYVAFENSAGGCAQPSTFNILAASKDSWVDQSSPGTNKGGDSVLKVTSKSGNANTRAFVGFDLPSLPTGCNMSSAYLYMYNTSPVSGRTLNVHRSGGSWTEGGVTWSNQPGTTGSPVTATMPSTANWVGWDVTSMVAAQYAGSNDGFRVADASEDAAAGPEQPFISREYPSAPPLLLYNVGG